MVSSPQSARPDALRPADALRPTATQALAAWADRVRAEREQVERCRELDDPADFYAPVAQRFRQDPFRADDAVLDALLELVRPGEKWLDIGAGGGRYALPLALRCERVIAVEPSAGMRDVLRAGMREHGIRNLEVREERWPPDTSATPRADAALMAHVGYDLEDIGPFLDAAEAAARRLCVAIVSESAMTTAASLFWEAVHAEPRVPLPALPELLTLLLARDRLPEVRLRPRVAPGYETPDDLMRMARRQLWVREGSERDARLADLVRGSAVRREGGWTLDAEPMRVAVVSWAPGA